MSRITTDLSMERARKVELLAKKNTPAFHEYRKINDAVMTPDRGFVKQLKKLDKEFEVVWDWGSSKWEIWKFPKEFGKEPYHITTVQTKNKTYRELGADVLLNLQWGRPDRFSLSELVNYLDELDNQVYRRKARDFRNKIESITKDVYPYVNTLFKQVPGNYSIQRMVTNE